MLNINLWPLALLLLLGCTPATERDTNKQADDLFSDSGVSASVTKFSKQKNSLRAHVRLENVSKSPICLEVVEEASSSSDLFVYVARANDGDRVSWDAIVGQEADGSEPERDLRERAVISPDQSIAYSVNLTWTEFKPYLTSRRVPPEPKYGGALSRNDPLVLVVEAFPRTCELRGASERGHLYSTVIARSQNFQLP